jgi:D-alanine-D-alanine ligase
MSLESTIEMPAVPVARAARAGRDRGGLRVVPDQARPRVALLFGGCADAYDGSCASAAAVLEVLDPQRYDIVPIQLCKGGQWVVGDAGIAALAAGRGPQDLAALLAPSEDETLAAGFRAATATLRTVDVALPAMHSRFGADATLQNVLQALGVPYVGSGAHASGGAGSKVMTRRRLAAHGIPVGPAAVLRPGVHDLNPGERSHVGLPAYVTCARGGHQGARRISRWEQLPAAVLEARAVDQQVMVEADLAGRRLELGVLELPGGELAVGAPVELLATDTWTRCEVPARVDPPLRRELNELAVRAFRALGCQGLLHLQVVVPRDGRPVVLAVDTLPPLAPAAPFMQLWRATGRSYADVLDVLLQAALIRGRRRPPLRSR